MKRKTIRNWLVYLAAASFGVAAAIIFLDLGDREYLDATWFLVIGNVLLITSVFYTRKDLKSTEQELPAVREDEE